MRCEDVLAALPGLVDGSSAPERRATRHVESCLRCQAELAQYRKLARVLHTLRTDVIQTPPGLLSDILDRLEEAGERSAGRALLRGRRVAYVSALAAATAAGAAGAIVLVTRNRRMRLAG